MTDKEKKKEIRKGFAIKGGFGLYVGWWPKRYEAIGYHVQALGKTWQQCKKDGDYVVKILIKEL